MSEAILCPQVGQDLTEAKVISLRVKIGDTVKRGDIVAEVESEKATFEVEAFAAGVVVALPYKVGDLAIVLEPLVVLGVAGEKSTVKKSGAPVAVAQPAANTIVHTPATSSGGQYGSTSFRSSPLARRIAENHGVELRSLTGTGPHGAVVVRDVESFVASGAKSAALVGVPFVANDKSALHLKSIKAGTGTPVIFIHGFGAELSAWRQIAMQFKFTNPAFAIDLPGHGASPEISSVNFQAIVEVVAYTLKANGHTSVHIVGHSLGAAVAIAISAKPEFSIRSLTLIAPAGLGASVDGNFVSGFLEAKSEAALAIQMQRLVANPASLPAALVRATFAARQASDLAGKQARVAAGVFEGSTQLFSVRSELGAYQGPARVILGKRDAVIPAIETEGAIPGHVAINRLENIGHLPFVEAEALVARLITETVRSGE